MVSQPAAPASSVQKIRDLGHVLRAAGEDDLVLTEEKRLTGQRDSLHSRGAGLVDGESRLLDRDARTIENLTAGLGRFPACLAIPNMTSSTWSGPIPALFIASTEAETAEGDRAVSLKEPPNLPIGVLAALRTTTFSPESLIRISLHLYQRGFEPVDKPGGLLIADDERRGDHHQVAVGAVGVADVRPEDESPFERFSDEGLNVLLLPREGRLLLFVPDEFDSEEKAFPSDVPT